jgi:L-asparaginase
MMKRIALIATGGTIAGQAERADDLAGYTAGTLGPEALLAAVPELAGSVRIVPETAFAIDSKDITTAHWLQLAHRVAARLAEPGVDGVVITHGTDTIEETAWFLHLTLPAAKPVVMTCAMRPATALSADGPLNLSQAVTLAASGLTTGLGVVVAVNGEIHAARDVSKRHCQAIDAIGSPDTGPLGRCAPAELLRRPARADAEALPLTSLGPLPDIPLIAVPGGADPIFLHLAVERGAPGVVLALPGNGSLPAHWHDPVESALDRGVVVVRASRTGAGRVAAKPGVPGQPAGTLAPAKARIALMLALAARRPEAFADLA